MGQVIRIVEPDVIKTHFTNAQQYVNTGLGGSESGDYP